MSNNEDTIYYGAANAGTSGQQTGTAMFKITPMKEGTRLGDEGVDLPDWLRKTTQEAQLMGAGIRPSNPGCKAGPYPSRIRRA